MKQAAQHKQPKTAAAKPARTKATKTPVKKAPSKAVSRARHQAAMKAARTRAKHAAKASKAHQPKKRQLALGEAVACCAAEALAASLRLAGAQVGADDVEALYWLTASDQDEGASILATLEAAAEYGLAGYRPIGWSHRRLFFSGNLAPIPQVIIGLDVPGPHAAFATGDTWWSWGKPWHRSAFPHAVIEEAWAVTW